MSSTSPADSGAVIRSGADRCPGVLRLTEAADGFLARVRLPGGLISAGQLRELARLAEERGDGRVELTSRGNVQLRGLATDAAGPLTDALAEAGLLPSLDHDRVRNVLASPLAGLDGGPDLTGLVRALDAALCARPRLAQLSGRFLFAIDDGRGDVAGLGADVVAVIRPEGAMVNGLWMPVPSELYPGTDTPADRPQSHSADLPADRDQAPAAPDAAGRPAGTSPRRAADGWHYVVAAMLAWADAFLDLRAAQGGTAWRIADLPGGPDQVSALVSARLRHDILSGGDRAETAAVNATARRTRAVPDSASPGVRGRTALGGPASRRVAADARDTARPVGLITPGEAAPGGHDHDLDGGGAGAQAPQRPGPRDSVVLLAPAGRLTAAQVNWLADRTAGEHARVTPWRSVVLPRVADPAELLREAADLGFGTDEASPWLRVTACAGRPGCGKALADVQADAASFAARWPGRFVHVSGCARHCGRPAATEIDVTATSEGYQVAGVRV